MKRPGITAKLFFAVLAMAAFVASVMAITTQLSFHRSFLGYLNEQAEARMDAAIPRLVQAYSVHGDWEFVRQRPDVWFNLLNQHRPPGQDPWSEDAAPVVDPELLGAGRRMSLLDDQGLLVMGFPKVGEDAIRRPIVWQGRTIGWLALMPVQVVTDAAALRFKDAQLRSTLVIGALALALSALVSWWMARGFLAPVKAVAAATHGLAAGQFGTRVEVTHRDEVGQLAADFNQLALTLERNERLRRELTADISHELRTPLAVLRAEIEALQDGVHPVTPEALRTLHGEVVTLTQLVGDLHELALADVGALSYRKAELDLAGFLHDEAQTFAASCAAHGLRLEVGPIQPGRLLADAARLRQLTHNLLDNALRYTDAGGCVRMACTTEDEQALIVVEDSAPAAPPEMLPRLFDRFYRVEASRGRAGGGSGLGLAICRSIVEAHGGQIAARPSALGGVRIEVRLPRLLAPGATAA